MPDVQDAVDRVRINVELTFVDLVKAGCVFTLVGVAVRPGVLLQSCFFEGVAVALQRDFLLVVLLAEAVSVVGSGYPHVLVVGVVSEDVPLEDVRGVARRRGRGKIAQVLHHLHLVDALALLVHCRGGGRLLLRGID